MSSPEISQILLKLQVMHAGDHEAMLAEFEQLREQLNNIEEDYRNAFGLDLKSSNGVGPGFINGTGGQPESGVENEDSSDRSSAELGSRSSNKVEPKSVIGARGQPEPDFKIGGNGEVASEKVAIPKVSGIATFKEIEMPTTPGRKRLSLRKEVLILHALYEASDNFPIGKDDLLQLHKNAAIEIKAGGLNTKLSRLKDSGHLIWKDTGDIKITDLGKTRLREICEEKLLQVEVVVIKTVVEEFAKDLRWK
ncbi:MAG: hypothetical protein COB78_04115 [Hyphomicrobiales bacterium]|nr:MAG: hypothetical protein COB78_04115 [Hyphomicrobiales bacterium]